MFSIIPQLKCILLFGPKLFTFVCFSLREKELTNKSFRENLLYHWHYFDSPRKDQRRFSEFNSFRFSDTEAFHFRFEMLLEEQLEQVWEIQTRVWVHIERYVQASVSWWTWPPLPRYQGTGIAYKLWWRTYPAAYTGSNLKSPSATVRPKNTYQGLFPNSLSLQITIYVPIWRLYDKCLFHRFPGIKGCLWLIEFLTAIKIFPLQFLGIKTCVLKILHTTARNLIFHKISGLEK